MTKTQRYLSGASLATLIVAVAAAPAFGQTAGAEAKWSARADAVGRTARDTTSIGVDLFAPLAQDARGLVYFNGSVAGDLDGEEYYSFGLGARRRVASGLILGGYAGVDRSKLTLDRNFSAVSLGVEAIGATFEGRLNVQLPVSDDDGFSDVTTTGPGTLVWDDYQLVDRYTTTRAITTSRAMTGVEGEVGARLPFDLSGLDDALRIFIGGYDYTADRVAGFGGLSGRLEYRIQDVMGDAFTQSELAFTAGVTDDDRYGTEFLAQVRLSLALGGTRSGARRELDPLDRRMTDPLVRNNRIETGQIVETSQSTTSAPVLGADGQALGRVVFVNSSGGGVGAPEDPTTLGDGVARAQAGGTIVVEGADGAIETGGVTLLDGQILLGGGAPVSVTRADGTVETVTLGQTRPTVTGQAGATVVTLGADNTLRGLDITGGAAGIVGDNVGALTLDDISIGGVTGDGVSIAGDGQAAITGLSVSDAGGAGLRIDGTGGTMVVTALSGLDIQGVQGGGVLVDAARFDADPATAAADLVQGGDASIGAGRAVSGPGLRLNAVSGGLGFGTLEIVNSGGAGLYIRDAGGKGGDFAFATTGGAISTVGGTAMDLDPLALDVTLASITSTDSPGAGIFIDTITALTPGSPALTVGEATVTGAAGAGVRIANADGGVAFGATTISDVGGDGIALAGNPGPVTFGDTTVSAAGGDGISIAGNAGAVTFGATTVTNAGGDGIALAENGGPVTFGDTAITSPGGNGVDISGVNGAVTFGALEITGLGAATGLDLTDEGGAATEVLLSIATLDISGTGASGSTGLDYSGASNPLDVIIGGPSTITGVGTGVDLRGAAASGDFRFGDGSATDANGRASTISAATPLAFAGLDATQGLYNLLDVDLGGNAGGLGGLSVFYVDADGGNDANTLDGSAADPGTLAQAMAAGADVIALVNSQSSSQDVIDTAAALQGAPGGLALADGQRLVSFLGAETINFLGQAAVPANLLVSGLGVGSVSNPNPGSGAPLLTSTEAGADTVSLGDNNLIVGVAVDNDGGGTALSGGGIVGLTVRDSQVDLLSLTDSSGVATLSDSRFGALNISGGSVTVMGETVVIDNGKSRAAISVGGGHDGTIDLDANSSVSDSAGTGLQFSNADGEYVFRGQVRLNGGDAGLDILNGSAGRVTLDDAEIAGPAGPAVRISDSSAVLAYGGVLSQTSGAAAILVDAFSGTAGFSGLVTASTGAADAVTLGLNGGAVSFTGGLDIDTTSGTGFIASGGTVTVSATAGDESIVSTAGQALDLDAVAGALSFDAIRSAGSAGAGLSVTNLSGALTAGSATVSASAGDGLAVSGGTGAVTVTGLTTVTGAGGAGVRVGGATQVTLGTVDIAAAAGPAIALNGDGGGFTVAGATTISNAGGGGIDISGATGTLSFGDVDITGLGAGAVGLDLNGAALAGTVDLQSLDVTGTGTSAPGGSIGLDLRGMTGGQTVSVGVSPAPDAAADTPSTIRNVAVGVYLDSASDAQFTFGDGEEAVDQASRLEADVAIDASSAPAQGSFNFLDVDFGGASPGLGFGSSGSSGAYYFTQGGTGSGAAADDPGSVAGAEASSAATLVPVGTAPINLDVDGGGTLDLDAGQDLLGADAVTGTVTLTYSAPPTILISATSQTSPGGGPSPSLINGSPQAVISAGGGNRIENITVAGAGGAGLSASGVGNIVLNNVSVSGTAGAGLALDGLTDMLVAGGGLNVSGAGGTGVAISAPMAAVSFTGPLNINNAATAGGGLSLSGAGTGAVSITGGLDIDTAAGTGLSVTGGTLTLGGAGNTIDSTGASAVSATSANDIVLSLTDLTASGGGGAPVIDLDGTGGGGLTITAFSGVTVNAGGTENGGVAIQSADFDGDPDTAGLQALNGGDLTIGASGARISGAGLSLTGVQGDLSFGALDIFNDGGIGLLVNNNALLPAAFTLRTASGAVDTTNGAAGFLDPLTLDMTLTSVGSTNAASSGLSFDQASGAFTVTGATTITDAGNDGIEVDDSGLDLTFGAVTVNDAGGDGVDLNDYTGDAVFGGLVSVDLSGSGENAVEFDNMDGTATFNGAVTLANAGIDAIQFKDDADGTATFNGAVTITSPTFDGLYLNDSAPIVTFNALLDIDDAGAYGLDADDAGGALTFGTVDIDTAGDGGARFADSAFTTVTFGQLDINAGAGSQIGFGLARTSGVFDINGGTIENVAGEAIGLLGSNATLTYTGAVTAATDSLLLVWDDLGTGTAETSTVTFEAGASLSATGGAVALDFSGADGTYTFNTAVTADGVTEAIIIDGASAGDVTFNDDVTLSNGSSGVLLEDASGTIAFNGLLDIDAMSATGIGAAGTIGTLDFATVDLDAMDDVGVLFLGAAVTSATFDRLDIAGTGAAVSGLAIGGSSGLIDIDAGLIETFATGGVVLSTASAVTLNYGGDINSTGGRAFLAQANDASTVTFEAGSSITTTGGTGIQFNAADGSYTFDGAVTLNSPDFGVRFTGVNAATTAFADLTVADLGANSVGLALNSATLTGSLSAADFTLTGAGGTPPAGSIGIGLDGASGGGTVSIGTQADPATDTPPSITNVATGVVLGGATNLDFTYGDGEDSTDQAAVLQATTRIDATNAPASGSYDFLDVDFPNFAFGAGFDPDVYFFTESGAGSGLSVADAGSVAGAEASSASILVPVGASAIDLDNDGGGTLSVDANQSLAGFDAPGGTLGVLYTIPAGIEISASDRTYTDTAGDGTPDLFNASAQTAVELGGGASMVNIGISGSGGAGVSAANVSDLTLDNVSVAGATGAGVDLDTISGTLTVQNGLSITSAGGVGLSIDGSDVAATLDSITTTGTGTGIALNDFSGTFRVTGATTLETTAILNANTDAQIAMTGVNTGSARFDGLVTIDNRAGSSAGRGVDLASGTLSFLGGVDVHTYGVALNASGGTLNIAAAATASLRSELRNVLTLDGATIGASGLNLNSVRRDRGLGAVSGDSVQIHNTDVGAAGISIADVDVAVASDDGISINGVTGAGGVTLTDVTVDEAGDDAIAIAGANSTINIGTGASGAISLGQSTANAGAGISVSGSGTINLGDASGAIVTSGGVNGLTGSGFSGTLTVAGPVTVTGTSGFGMAFGAGNTGSATFSGLVTIDNDSGADGGGVDLDSGALTFSGGLDIDTTTAAGISADGGTLNVLASGTNTVTAGDALAVQLSGMTVDTTFDSITSTRTSAGAGVDLDDLDGTFALNGGNFSAPVGANYGAVEIHQDDGSATRALTASIDGISVVQSAPAGTGQDEYGVDAYVNGDDALTISVTNSSFQTEDQAVFLDGTDGGSLTVTDLSNLTLLGDASASVPTVFNNGVDIHGVTFDADPDTLALDAVSGGVFTAGTGAEEVAIGLALGSALDPAGSANEGVLTFDTLDIVNARTALAVSGDQQNLTLRTLDGQLSGHRAYVAPSTSVTLDMTLDSIDLDQTQFLTSHPLEIANAAGSFTVTGATSLRTRDFVQSAGGGNVFYITDFNALDVADSSLDLSFAALTIGASAGPAPSGFVAGGDGPTHGIHLNNHTGGFTVTGGTTITSTVENAIWIEGGAPTIDFQNDVTLSESGTGNAYGLTYGPARSFVQNAILFEGVTGGSANFGGAVTIDNPGDTGVRFTGTNAAAVTFADLNIALEAGNTTGFDASGAVLNANVTATDFDLTSASATGTTGVDLSGTTGTGTLRLGDSNVGGASATILGTGGNASGPEVGALFSSTTELDFIFGDGENATDAASAITAVTAIDDDGSGLPVNGSYNFLDVVLTGNTSALGSGIQTYVVDQAQNAGGAGTFASPGSIANAEASSANVIVLIDSDIDAAEDDIDMGAGALDLDDNQALISLFGGQTIDMAALGFGAGGGAPASFQLNGVNTGAEITAPNDGSVDSVTPRLLSSSTAVNLGGSSAIANTKITTTGGTAVSGMFGAAETLTLRDVVSTGAGASLSLMQSGGALTLDIDGGQYTNFVSMLGGAGGSFVMTADDTAFDGGIAFAGAAGTATITDSTAGGVGLDGGSIGLDADNFDLTANSESVFDVRGGHTGTVDFDAASTINATGATGLQFSNADGSYTFNGSTTLNGGDAGIDILSGSGGTFVFGGNTSITNPSGTAFLIDGSAPTVTYSGTIAQTNAAEAVSVTSMIGGSATFNGAITASTGGSNAISILDSAGGAVTFADTLDIDTTSAAAFRVNGGGTVSVEGTGNMFDSTLASAIDVDDNSQALVLGLANIAATGGGGTPIIDIAGSGGGSVRITDFADIAVVTTGAELGGVAFDTVTFDADPSDADFTGDTVNGGDLAIGASGNPVLGAGLLLDTVSGDLSFDDLSVHSVGTGLEVIGSGSFNAGAGTGFRLATTSGTINSTSSSGVLFDPFTSAVTLTSVTAGGGTNGILLDAIDGTFAVTGATNITGTSGFGILQTNGSTVSSTFGGQVTVDNDGGVTGGGVRNVSGTLTFNAGLDIDTTSGRGVELNGGQLNVAASGTRTVDTTTGQGVYATGGTFNANFTSMNVTDASTLAMYIGSGSGSLTVGGGSVTDNGALPAVSILQSNMTLDFGAAVTNTSAGNNILSLQNNTGGSYTFSGNLTEQSIGGIYALNNSGGTFTFSGASKDFGSVGSGSAVTLDGNTGATFAFTNGGLDIDGTNGTMFSATGGGTVTVTGAGNTITSTTGTAVNIANTTIGGAGITFDSINVNGAASGILLSNVGAGAFTASGGAIQNVTSRGVDVSLGTGDVSIGASISGTSTARTVEVTSHSGGTVAFSGAIDDNGLGVRLQSNFGAAVNFSGGLDIDTVGNNTGFLASASGTLNVTGTNTVNTSAGTGEAVNIANTTIGGAGVTFQRVDVDGANNGILLTNTGSGAFSVTGDGGSAVNGSGGTLQNVTNDAIRLTNVANASFDQLNMSSVAGNGVLGARVNGFSYANATLGSIGNADGEDAFNFDRDTQGNAGLYGTALFQNLTITNFAERGIDVVNEGSSGVSLDLDVLNVSMRDNNDTFGEDAIRVQNEGNNNADVLVSGGTYMDIESDVLAYFAQGTGANTVRMTGVASTGGGGPDNLPNGGGVAIIGSGGSTTNFTIDSNNLTDVQGAVVQIIGLPGAGQTVTLNGTIGGAGALGNVFESRNADGLDLDFDGDPGAGSTINTTILVENNTINFDDDGIGVDFRDAAGTANVTIVNNTLTAIAGDDGGLDHRDGVFIFTDNDAGAGAATLNVAIRDNVFDSMAAIGVADIIDIPGVQDGNTVCVDIANNSGNSTLDTFEFNNNASTLLSVQASEAALLGGNSVLGTVEDTGTITYGSVACSVIPTP